MKEISTIGLDIAKKVFQVHAVDLAGAVIVRRSLRRAQVLEWFAKLPPCVVGMEACATANYWARELQKLGHDCAADSAGLCKGVCAAEQERPGGRRGNL